MNDLRAKVEYSPSALVDEYGPALYRLCRSLTFSREDGEDLFQDTFLKALEKPGRRLAGDPRQYLFSMALSLWKSRKRKYARRARVAPMEPLTDETVSVSGPEEELLDREENRRVRTLVAALPEKYRLPLVLYYSMEMKVNEIAKTLSLPEGTVKRRLYTARGMVEKGLVDDE